MAKNLLFISIDDLADLKTLASLYDGAIATPNLDRLMSSGVTFENAFSQAPICNASRTSVLSGQSPLTTTVFGNQTPWDKVVPLENFLPVALREAGHYVATGGKVFHGNKLDPQVEATLFDETLSVEGADVGRFFTDGRSAQSAEELGIDPEELIDVDLAEEAAAFLQNYEQPDPFSLMVGFHKPHASWVVPQSYYDMYDLDKVILPELVSGDFEDIPNIVRRFVPDRHQQIEDAGIWAEYVRGYLASVSYVDAQLGKVLEALEAGGHADDTAIVLWSDHGYHLGDRAYSWEKFTLWEEAARAPLVIVDPDADAANQGKVVSQPVGLIDLAPTVLDLLGVQPPAHYEGETLRPFLDDPDGAEGDPVMTWMQGNFSIRDEQYRYTRYIDGSEELYDVVADPKQFNNLASEPALAAVKAELLAEAMGRTNVVTNPQTVEAGEDDLVIVLGGQSGPIIGSAADDMYFIDGRSEDGLVADGRAQVIAERADGGDDLMIVDSYGLFTVPENIEQIHIASYAGTLSEQRKVIAGDGAQRIFTASDADWVEAGGGDDFVFSNGGQDRIMLGAGDDVGEIRRGEAAVFGGEGNDELRGGANSQALYGESGADMLSGGGGADELFGGAGNDQLIGGAGADLLDGGEGADVADYSAALDGVKVTGKQFSDEGERLVRDSSGGRDTLRNIETIIGGAGDDLLRVVSEGHGGSLFGGVGADSLFGDALGDVLTGGGGRRS